MCHLIAVAAITSASSMCSFAQAETLPPDMKPPKSTRLSAPVVSAPMEEWGTRPAVMARINGKGPFRLDVDTGTTMTALIDDSVAKELGLPVPQTVPGLGAVEESDPVEVNSITIGDVVFSKVHVMVADFDSFMPATPDAPVGILGLPLFEDCLFTFDYPNQRFIFEMGELPPPGGDVIAYSPDPDRDYGVTIEAIVAGTPMKTHVDTGSPGFLTMLTKWQDKIPLAGKPRVVGRAQTPSGATEISAAKLNGVIRVGDHEFHDPSVDFADLGPMVEFDCANIGSGMLKDFAMTIDQQNRRIRLRRSGSGTARTTRKPHQGSDSPFRIGVAFAPGSTGWKVSAVTPGSAAEKSGIKPGDVVTMVNGKPIGAIARDELGRLFGSPTPVTLKVDRDGRTLEVPVTPQRTKVGA